MSVFTAPKSFWKYYDLYRRKKINLHEYATLSLIAEKELVLLLARLYLSQKTGERDLSYNSPP